MNTPSKPIRPSEVAVAHPQQLIGLGIDTCSACPHPWPVGVCPLCAPGPMAPPPDNAGHPAADTDVETALLRGLRMTPPLLILRGGECLLRENALELLTACRQSGVARVEVWTAGPLLGRPRFAQAIHKAGATDVGVLLFGDTAEGHDYVAGAAGHFARVLTGVQRARAAGLGVRLLVPVLRPTFRGLVGVVRKAIPAGVKGLYLWAPPGPDRSAHPLLAPLPLVASYVQAAVQLARTAGMDVRTEGLPACHLGPHAGLAVASMPAISAGPVQSGELPHAFGPPCAACTWQGRCAGLPQPRIDEHGWVGTAARSDPAQLPNLPARVAG